jgi:hypothetical protein
VFEACADSGKENKLPSWVPDLRRPWAQDEQLWSQKFQKNSDEKTDWNSATRSLALSKKERHSGLREWEFINTSSLRVRGFFVGRITALSAIANVIEDLNQTAKVEERLFRIIQCWVQCSSEKTKIDYKSDEKVAGAILRSMYDSKLHRHYDGDLGGFVNFQNNPKIIRIQRTLNQMSQQVIRHLNVSCFQESMDVSC